MSGAAEMTMRAIAFIENDFAETFGIPRQSGLADMVESRVVFEPEYRSRDAVRGIEGFSHLWLLWGFSENPSGRRSLTVRPPRLGGNARMGVFATRSPFRPNPIGLSCVELAGVEDGRLIVRGADLMNGSPIYDIKPYLPYADCRPEATGGFADSADERTLEVVFPEELLAKVPERERAGLAQVLSHDPRPAYQESATRVYGLRFGSVNVRFTVFDGKLRVSEVN